MVGRDPALTKVEDLFNQIRWRVRLASTIQEHLDRAMTAAGIDGKHIIAAAWDRAEALSFEQALATDQGSDGKA